VLNQKNSQWKRQKGWVVLAWIIVMSLLLSGCGALQPKVYRVGMLSGSTAFGNVIGNSFKARMTELGYVEGQNIVYDFQQVDNNPDKEKQALAKFVADKVDLIFVFPTQPAVEAQAATQGTNIPVVFSMTVLEGNTLVKSVSEPGGNMTGVRLGGPDNSPKRLEWLLEIAPKVKRVYVPYDPTYPTNPSALKTLRPAASNMGVTLVEAPIANVAELQADLDKHAQAGDIGIDAVLMMPESLTATPEAFGAILKFANEHKIPIAGMLDFTADQGALFSYAFAIASMGVYAAPAADKILKGTPAGTIPVVTCDDQLRINYKAAQALGLTIPEGLLKQASEIIR